MQHEILKKKVGQNVELGVWRKGQTMKIAITTGELPNEIGQPAALQPPPGPNLAFMSSIEADMAFVSGGQGLWSTLDDYLARAELAGRGVDPGFKGIAPQAKILSIRGDDAGIAGLEFLRGIPGTVGGFVRMNGGAYGREVCDILISCRVALRNGSVEEWPAEKLGYTYRHSDLPEGAVVTEAVLKGMPGDPAVIGAEMERIAAAREKSQPLRSRTGGSTFKNPAGTKAWMLIDAAGMRKRRRLQERLVSIDVITDLARMNMTYFPKFPRVQQAMLNPASRL